MKVQVILPLTLVVSVALVGLMKLRKKEYDKENRLNKFEDIKLRVTYDVLREYESEKARMQNLLEKTKSEHNAMEEEVNKVGMNEEKAKGEVDICQGEQKSARDQLATVETEFNSQQAANDKEKASWKAEEESLKVQLAARSSVCDFVKTQSLQAASQLCGNEVKVEEPKAEAPKQEEPKAEAPKQEEPKAEAPKQEEPKAEAPKQEEPKAEAPKQEEPKAEAPKQEEPKAEAPKQEEPKAEAPKQEEPKAEAPKKR
uniref:Zgc:174935 n=1 Tax=Dicentrarchus labrax TaxID=13489 RepID=A0A8P4KNZ7_DICLA